MKTLIVAAALAATALTAGAAQAAPDRVKVGLLSCNIDAGFGYLIGSNKGLDCWFKPSGGGHTEHYTGSVKKLGIDIGYTAGAKIEWLVFAAQGAWHSHALAGSYVGASTEATLGVGLGANWLDRRLGQELRAAAAERAGPGRPQLLAHLDRPHPQLRRVAPRFRTPVRWAGVFVCPDHLFTLGRHPGESRDPVSAAARVVPGFRPSPE